MGFETPLFIEGQAFIKIAIDIALHGGHVFVVLDALAEGHELAGGLPDIVRRLDARGLSLIHAELAPPAGVGAAFNDRLTRAAAR